MYTSRKKNHLKEKHFLLLKRAKKGNKEISANSKSSKIGYTLSKRTHKYTRMNITHQSFFRSPESVIAERERNFRLYEPLRE